MPNTRLNLKALLTTAATLTSLALPAPVVADGGDRDRDRMPDRWERKHRLSVGANDAARDRDRDGLRNLTEYRAATNPRKADSDRDGVSDGREDHDRDRVQNASEDREATSPARTDTDRDGVRDGAEDADRDGLDNRGEELAGMDPIDPDSDDDGIADGAEAGTVARFADGVLTVRLANGDSLSGEVTDDETEIRCDPAVELARWDEWDDDQPEWRNGVRGMVGATLLEEDSDWDGEGLDEDSDSTVVRDITCYADSLVTGAIVHTAHLERVNDGLVFTRIQLAE